MVKCHFLRYLVRASSIKSVVDKKEQKRIQPQFLVSNEDGAYEAVNLI